MSEEPRINLNKDQPGDSPAHDGPWVPPRAEQPGQPDNGSSAPVGAQTPPAGGTPQGPYPVPGQPVPGQYPAPGQYGPPGQYAAPGQYGPPGQYPPPGQYGPPGQYPVGAPQGGYPPPPRRNNTAILIAALIGGVAFLLVAGIVVVLVVTGLRGDRSAGPAVGTASTALPGAQEITAQGVVAAPGATGAPSLVIYEDVQCPHCQSLHEELGPVLDEARADGSLTLEYRFLTFLDENRGNDLSQRGTEATICAAGVGRFNEFHDHLLTDLATGNEPTTADFLVNYSAQAQVPSDRMTEFRTCVEGREQEGAVIMMNSKNQGDGIPGTPTLVLNGRTLDPSEYATPDVFRQTLRNG